MTRQEHLDWCKQRALEYANNGNLNNALASMLSDMGKHPETANHLALELGMTLKLGGYLNTPAEMREWIEGFN